MLILKRIGVFIVLGMLLFTAMYSASGDTGTEINELQQLAEVAGDRMAGPLIFEKYTYSTYKKVPRDVAQRSSLIGKWCRLWQTEMKQVLNLPASEWAGAGGGSDLVCDLHGNDRQNIVLLELRLDGRGNEVKLTCSLRTSQTAALDQLFKEYLQLKQALLRHGVRTDWQAMVHGQLGLQDSIDEYVRVLKKRAVAQTIDVFAEPGMRNYTYFSPTFSNSVFSGRKRMNLQLNAYRHSESKRWHVSLGAPLVTVVR